MYHESYRHHKNIDATSDDAGVIREILNFNCIDADLSAGFPGELGRSKFWKDQTTNPNFSSGSQTTEAFILLWEFFFHKHSIDAIDAMIDQHWLDWDMPLSGHLDYLNGAPLRRLENLLGSTGTQGLAQWLVDVLNEKQPNHLQ